MNKPNLFFLHGWGMPAKIAEPFLRAFEKKYEVMALDLPGYGEHAHLPCDFESSVNFLAQRIPAGSIVIAWSMAGLLATALALRHPHNIRYLFLMTSSPYFLQTQTWPGIAENILEKFHENLQKDLKKTLFDFVDLQCRGMKKSMAQRLFLEEILAVHEPTTLTLNTGLAILRDWDFREKIGDLNLPLAYIWGGLDAIVPKQSQQAVSVLAPSAKHLLIKQAGHLPFLSHQMEVVNFIEACLHETF